MQKLNVCTARRHTTMQQWRDKLQELTEICARGFTETICCFCTENSECSARIERVDLFLCISCNPHPPLCMFDPLRLTSRKRIIYKKITCMVAGAGVSLPQDVPISTSLNKISVEDIYFNIYHHYVTIWYISCMKTNTSYQTCWCSCTPYIFIISKLGWIISYPD